MTVTSTGQDPSYSTVWGYHVQGSKTANGQLTDAERTFNGAPLPATEPPIVDEAASYEAART